MMTKKEAVKEAILYLKEGSFEEAKLIVESLASGDYD